MIVNLDKVAIDALREALAHEINTITRIKKMTLTTDRERAAYTAKQDAFTRVLAALESAQEAGPTLQPWEYTPGQRRQISEMSDAALLVYAWHLGAQLRKDISRPTLIRVILDVEAGIVKPGYVLEDGAYLPEVPDTDSEEGK